jgi:hypothetical protein
MHKIVKGMSSMGGYHAFVKAHLEILMIKWFVKLYGNSVYICMVEIRFVTLSSI